MAYPYHAPMQQPPPRRNTGLRTALIIVGVVIAVCCVGGAAGGFLLYRSIRATTAPVAAAAAAFVTDLEAGRVEAAYDRLCASTRTAFTPEAFADKVAGSPKIRGHSVDGVSVDTTNGRSTATVNMILKLDSGFDEDHTVELLKEDGVWKVCGRPY